MKISAIILLLLFATVFHAYGSGRIDSLMALAANSTNDTTRINALLELGIEHKRIDHIKFLRYSDSAFHMTVNLARKLNSHSKNFSAEEKIEYRHFAVHSSLRSLYNCALALFATGNFSGSGQYLAVLDAISRKWQANRDTVISSAGNKYLTSVYMQSGRISSAQGNHRQALDNYHKALELSRSINNKFGIADAYNCIGALHYTLGDFPKMLEYLSLSMKVCEELNDLKSLSTIYNNIGLFYDYQGNYPLAIEYYQKGIAINDSAASPKSLANSYMNIGIVYRLNSEYTSALEYYGRCLKIFLLLNDADGLSKLYNNYANLCSDQHDYVKSIRFHRKSIWYRELMGNKRSIAMGYTNIAGVFIAAHSIKKNESLDSLVRSEIEVTGDISFALVDSAEYYLSKAVPIQKEIDDKVGLTYSYNGLGGALLMRGKHQTAFEYFRMAAELSSSIGAKKEILDAYKGMYEVRKIMMDFKEALEYFEEFKTRSDSLFNEESRKNLTRAETRFEYEKKLQEQKSMEEKNNIISAEEIKRQKLFRNSFVLVSVLILVVAFIVYNRYRLKRKANEKLAAQNAEIIAQKEIIENQQNDIIDSIEYASYLQQAILPEMNLFSELFSDSFIIYHPRDIVSGDFYWITRHHDSKYLLAADCTGHGVPGAFLSMLGTSLFREIITERNVTDPGKILDAVRLEIISALKQRGRIGESRDGMDAVLVRITEGELRSVQVACANNSFYLVRNNVLSEIKGDRFHVGLSGDILQPFSTHYVEPSPGDMLYLVTDGFEDQFGGGIGSDTRPGGKKFKSVRLKELLTSVSGKNVPDQKEIIEKTFHDWKGNVEQTDDVTVIGIRV